MASSPAEAMDRRAKWGLLVISLVTLCLLGYAVLSEAIWPPWRRLRQEYARVLEAKATDERGRVLAKQFEIAIQQNVLPTLQTVDRCITCHPGVDDPRMAAEKQPFRTHPGDYLRQHPPDSFGCTICHRGQGRALAMAEAKAVGHHWDYPMLPIALTQSSCGVCHGAEEMAGRGGEKYALGRQLFMDKGCLGCHKLNGRGGSLGVALDNEGLKVSGQLLMARVQGDHTLPQWLIEHFANPQQVVPGSQMKPPQLSGEETEALTVYVLSLQNRDLPRSYLAAAKHLEYYQAAQPAQADGEALYNTYCAVCHDTGRFGVYDRFFGRFIPAVRGSSFTQTASAAYITEMVRQGRPGTIMPAWGGTAGGLSAADIAALHAFLTAAPLAANEVLPPEMLARARDPAFTAAGDVRRGAALFSKNCSACHGADGGGALAPSLANAVFQSQASAGFRFVTIALGRRNTAMPAFLAPGKGGFGAAEITDLVAFLRTLGGPASSTAAEPTLPAAARQQRNAP